MKDYHLNNNPQTTISGADRTMINNRMENGLQVKDVVFL